MFYNHVANQVKKTDKPIRILDLGCGTGLELEGIFSNAPKALITGVNMSENMLFKLQEKYKGYLEQNIRLHITSRLMV